MTANYETAGVLSLADPPKPGIDDLVGKRVSVVRPHNINTIEYVAAVRNLGAGEFELIAGLGEASGTLLLIQQTDGKFFIAEPRS